MARPRKVFDISKLMRLVDKGWTHQQIADHIYQTTGQHVARSTVSAYISRAGRSTMGHRYDDCLPWRVQVRHTKEYPARMLRLLGRQRAGEPLSAEDEKRLASWLAMMTAENAVVGYDPTNPAQGFHYIDPYPGDGENGIPIHVQLIKTMPPEGAS